MRRRYMLDTDICSYIFRSSFPQLLPHLEANKDTLCISAVTWAEMLYGAKKRASSKLDFWLKLFRRKIEVIPWDESAVGQYVALRAALEAEGGIIGNNDMMIAASALALHAVLITNNTAHFSRIANLKLENWTV